MSSIKKIIKDREITELIHFTSTRGLEGIFKARHILSRFELENSNFVDDNEILFNSNDTFRMEGKNYINLSVSKPNKSLFNRFKHRKESDPTIGWCILKINPHVLLDDNLKCFFSITNAANSAAKNDYGIKSDVESFKKMFNDEVVVKNSYGSKTYSRFGLNKNQTTDNQAEILVEGKIPFKYINAICFETEHEKIRTSNIWSYLNLDNSKFEVDGEIFK